MALETTAKSRAPRGTKILTQAFFSAADDIPEAQRATVIKAAVAAIRDELREGRAKVKIAKAKTKAKAAPAGKPGPRAKLATKTAKRPAVVLTAKGKPRAKPGPKPGAKAMRAAMASSAPE